MKEIKYLSVSSGGSSLSGWGVPLNYTSSYHPQSDGQSEGLNQFVESYLHCMSSTEPNKWAKWLALAEFWYNTNYHSGLQFTPFQDLYGYTLNHFSLGPYMELTSEDVKDEIK